MAFARRGDHFIGEVKGANSGYPKAVIKEHCPMGHGKFIAYRAEVEGFPIYAIGIRRGKMKVRTMISTCLTTALTSTQEWDEFDDEGDRVARKYDITEVQASSLAGVVSGNVHGREGSGEHSNIVGEG